MNRLPQSHCDNWKGTLFQDYICHIYFLYIYIYIYMYIFMIILIYDISIINNILTYII